MKIRQRFRTPKLLLTVLASILGVAAWLSGAQPVAAANPAYGSCQAIHRQVALAPGQPLNQTISGTLCTPITWANGAHHVDIMVHGATYNSQYWDFPVDQAANSYVNPTLQAGRASFAYDRLSAGTSSRPLGTAVTLDVDAYILHQLIGWLQPNYPETTVIGHSLGSVVSAQEAATYNDGKRLVLTGYLHGTAIGLGLPQVFGSFYPATLDPQFAGTLDLTYLTTRPGTRASVFYYTPTANPSVIAYDEAHKDVMSTVELTAAVSALELPAPLNTSNKIKVPTMLVVGDHDALFCGLLLDCTNTNSVASHEKPFYKSAANLTVKTVPNTGHDLTLHPSSQQSHAMIDTWLQTH